MRIGIDVRYLSHGLLNGIHTYLINLVPALIASAPNDEFVLYADRKCPFELTDLPANVTVRLLSWQHAIDSVRHDLTFARQVSRDRLDVMHYPANYGIAPQDVPTVITLHDALNIFPIWEAVRRDLKKPKTVARTLYLQAMTRYSLGDAAMLITVSENAKRDILCHRVIPADTIVPIPHAPASIFWQHPAFDALAQFREKYHLPPAFVLADALKNPAVLVRAWAQLSPAIRDQFQIVFFSRREDVLPVVQESIARREAQLVIRPSDGELGALYRLASAFVFPSWIEGFGLPILEAMACGTPVIASDRYAIPEVAGGAALLIDAEDANGLCQHLTHVLSDPEYADRLRGLGIARAAQFSWERSAMMVMEVYRTAVERARMPIVPTTSLHDDHSHMTVSERPANG